MTIHRLWRGHKRVLRPMPVLLMGMPARAYFDERGFGPTLSARLCYR